jgi:hypothetical protein
MNYFKGIFDPSIFAYLIVDGIIKNTNYFYNLKQCKQPQCKQPQCKQPQCKQPQCKQLQCKQPQCKQPQCKIISNQTQIDEIKKSQINYYNKKFTQDWAIKYNLRQTIKKELKCKN